MKKVNVSMIILALGFVSLSAISCKDTKKEPAQSEISTATTGHTGSQLAPGTKTIIDGYMVIKDALVGDSKENAAQAAQAMEKILSEFDLQAIDASKQSELKQIIAATQKRAGEIAKGTIAEQRAAFEGLSAGLVDFVAITGTPVTLYQQFCPMYNNDKGGMWVSVAEAVKNPYFGSEMLNCGFVQQEIN